MNNFLQVWGIVQLELLRGCKSTTVSPGDAWKIGFPYICVHFTKPFIFLLDQVFSEQVFMYGFNSSFSSLNKLDY